MPVERIPPSVPGWRARCGDGGWAAGREPALPRPGAQGCPAGLSQELLLAGGPGEASVSQLPGGFNKCVRYA